VLILDTDPLSEFDHGRPGGGHLNQCLLASGEHVAATIISAEEQSTRMARTNSPASCGFSQGVGDEGAYLELEPTSLQRQRGCGSITRKESLLNAPLGFLDLLRKGPR
jgi:hypothetical protein